MITEQRQITVNGLRIEIVRKNIKNLHLGVYPPNGRVRVAAPVRVNDDAVRLAVIGKLGWIKRHRARFDAQPRQSRREMVSGETHYFLGRPCRLRVHATGGRARVTQENKAFLDLYVRPDAGAAQREQALSQWYRERLRELIPPLLEKWQRRLGVEAAAWGIKRMKTKWGSCNPRARRIWLNLELAKKSPQCLEYIVVHELAHLIERRHSDAFIAIMNQRLSQWRIRQQTLNSAPLVHESWRY